MPFDAMLSEIRLHVTARRFAQAEELCRRVLVLEPANTDAHIALSEILSAATRIDEAILVLRKLVAVQPGNASHFRRLGSSLLARGEGDAAVAAFEKSIELDPRSPRGHNNLGEAYFVRGDLHRAAACYRQAIRFDPNSASAYCNLGRALHKLGAHADAVACLERAIRINPTLFHAHMNLGRVMRLLGRLAEAQQCFESALARAPEQTEVMYELAMVMGSRGEYGSARLLLARLEQAAPDLPYLLGYRVLADLSSAEWDGLTERIAQMELEIARGLRSCSPFVSLLACASPRLQRQCAETYMAFRCPERGRAGRPSLGDDTRLHLGYLSADFHDHATAHLMAGLFESHDRARFKVTALSIGPPADDRMARRLRRAFGHIEELHGQSDAQCRERIAALGVQILIDLKGHTYDARPEILAMRAAPLQVSYLGYPGTMGADFIDYLIADAHVVPPQNAVHYSEKIVRLATSYQVNDRRPRSKPRTPSREECGLPNKCFVFCCFNAVQKILPAMFAAWMRILERVEGGVLWLQSDRPAVSDNLRHAAARLGVDPARLVFASRVPHEHHLARYRHADLFLDTLPYNAHTSGSDALSAGCPLLTVLGSTFAGRVGASMLQAVGAPDLITHSIQEYEERAVYLATHASALAELKRRLLAGHGTAPLFDTDRTRRELEQAYATMWARHARGLAPESFAISAPAIGPVTAPALPARSQ